MAVATRTRKSPRRQRVEAAINYPLDWLEERSGLVGGVRYFLFRKVPGDTNWMQTLGSATLTAFLVQAITGVILAMYYKPEPKTAYASIQHITNDVTLGWLVRGMHKWGASIFIILMFLHMGRVFLFGAYKYPRELNWIVGVMLLAIGMHLYLVVRLGVTSPPWSKEAAGQEIVDEYVTTNGRSGLTRPTARGTWRRNGGVSAPSRPGAEETPGL